MSRFVTRYNPDWIAFREIPRISMLSLGDRLTVGLPSDFEPLKSYSNFASASQVAAGSRRPALAICNASVEMRT